MGKVWAGGADAPNVHARNMLIFTRLDSPPITQRLLIISFDTRHSCLSRRADARRPLPPVAAFDAVAAGRRSYLLMFSPLPAFAFARYPASIVYHAARRGAQRAAREPAWRLSLLARLSAIKVIFRSDILS